jgi:hypothetical protein
VVFSTLDLKAGYWQVPLREEDKEKTAFATKGGLYEFNMMPFELADQRPRLPRLHGQGTRPAGVGHDIPDDIIVFSQDKESHLEHLRTVFQKLQGAGLKTNTKKCVWLLTEVKFLGFTVSNKGIRSNPEKTESIKKW